jgi:uncharacterized LabA/DUF88 family protein
VTQVRAALYLDFDNVFSGLLKLDPQVAVRFAEQPGVWVERLAGELLVDGSRRWLVLRCYLNPGGSVPHPDGDSAKERLYFSRFREYFTRAGFEIIDCPRLSHTKNAADIRLVMDAMDALGASVTYDEFVIASGDSDMTPLLVRLRAEDRRTTVVSPSDAAAAFVSVADRFIDGEQFLSLVQGETPDDDEGSAEDSISSASDHGGTPEELAAREITHSYRRAAAPLNLATLAARVRRVLDEAGHGEAVSASSWFGLGSFTSYLDGLRLEGASRSTHYVWDNRRHQPPEQAVGEDREPLVPEPVARLSSFLSLPGLPRERWPEIYSVLSEYANTHSYNLSEATRWGRDQLAARGSDVGRRAVVAVVTGATHGGCPLFREPRPSPADIGRAFVANSVSRAGAADVSLSEGDVASVYRWFGVQG